MKQLIRNIPVLSALARKAAAIYRTNRDYRAFKRALSQSPLKIVVGSERVYQPGWIPSDKQYFNLLNLQHWQTYFQPNSIDAILSEHVWEHMTLEQGQLAAKNCYQYLKPGSYMRVAVPDGYHPDPQYIEWVKVNGTGYCADDHKVLYTYETFSEVFEQAGFKVRLLEYFDQNGEFHAVDWDENEGKINRSQRFDKRNVNGELVYTSLIIDAIKVS